ncbi:PIN domain-containing protein [Halalkalicoccus tibetensis]|uniref:Ribonuclease VapC n=1 Tax=Halalkalicoccus tibetensis TaxID=175632 RepID=A0ABD5V4P5_9EURY
MTLIDASFLIDYTDPEADHHEAALNYLSERDGPYFTSPVALYELYEGVAWVHGPEAIDDVEEDLWWVEPVEFSASIAVRAARLTCSLKRSGDEINGADALIAATALAIDQPVLANDRHFDRIDGLDVLSYV